MMLRLYVIPWSPWSEKARWALDVQGVPHEVVPHLPVVGAPALRLRAGRKLRGPVTLPLAVHNGEVLADSFAIARFGSRRSTTPLVPAAHEAAIARWNDRSERLLAAGRVQTTRRLARDGDAAREYVPAPLRRLRRVGGLVGRRGAARLLRKYAHVAPGHPPVVLREGLEELRAGLRAGGGEHLVGGTLTYADLAMAVALQFVEPVDERFIPLGPHSRDHWRDPDLAEAFADLIAWRDALYARWRLVDAATVAQALGRRDDDQPRA